MNDVRVKMKLNERESEVLEVIEYLAWNIFLSQTSTSSVTVSISIRWFTVYRQV